MGKKSKNRRKTANATSATLVESIPDVTKENAPQQFERDDEHYWEEITFVCAEEMFCVPLYRFQEQSPWFMEKICPPPSKKFGIVVELDDLEVEPEEFQSFLSALYPRYGSLDEVELHDEQWLSVMRLAADWGFNELKQRAISRIGKLDPVHAITLGYEYDIPSWVMSGYLDFIIDSDTTPISQFDTIMLGVNRAKILGQLVEKGAQEKWSRKRAKEVIKRVFKAEFDILGPMDDSDDETREGTPSGDAEVAGGVATDLEEPKSASDSPQSLEDAGVPLEPIDKAVDDPTSSITSPSPTSDRKGATEGQEELTPNQSPAVVKLAKKKKKKGNKKKHPTPNAAKATGPSEVKSEPTKTTVVRPQDSEAWARREIYVYEASALDDGVELDHPLIWHKPIKEERRDAEPVETIHGATGAVEPKTRSLVKAQETPSGQETQSVEKHKGGQVRDASVAAEDCRDDQPPEAVEPLEERDQAVEANEDEATCGEKEDKKGENAPSEEALLQDISASSSSCEKASKTEQGEVLSKTRSAEPSKKTLRKKLNRRKGKSTRASNMDATKEVLKRESYIEHPDSKTKMPDNTSDLENALEPPSRSGVHQVQTPEDVARFSVEDECQDQQLLSNGEEKGRNVEIDVGEDRPDIESTALVEKTERPLDEVEPLKEEPQQLEGNDGGPNDTQTRDGPVSQKVISQEAPATFGRVVPQEGEGMSVATEPAKSSEKIGQKKKKLRGSKSSKASNRVTVKEVHGKEPAQGEDDQGRTTESGGTNGIESVVVEATPRSEDPQNNDIAQEPQTENSGAGEDQALRNPPLAVSVEPACVDVHPVTVDEDTDTAPKITPVQAEDSECPTVEPELESPKDEGSEISRELSPADRPHAEDPQADRERMVEEAAREVASQSDSIQVEKPEPQGGEPSQVKEPSYTPPPLDNPSEGPSRESEEKPVEPKVTKKALGREHQGAPPGLLPLWRKKMIPRSKVKRETDPLSATASVEAPIPGIIKFQHPADVPTSRRALKQGQDPPPALKSSQKKEPYQFTIADVLKTDDGWFINTGEGKRSEEPTLQQAEKFVGPLKRYIDSRKQTKTPSSGTSLKPDGTGGRPIAKPRTEVPVSAVSSTPQKLKRRAAQLREQRMLRAEPHPDELTLADPVEWPSLTRSDPQPSSLEDLQQSYNEMIRAMNEFDGRLDRLEQGFGGYELAQYQVPDDTNALDDVEEPSIESTPPHNEKHSGPPAEVPRRWSFSECAPFEDSSYDPVAVNESRDRHLMHLAEMGDGVERESVNPPPVPSSEFSEQRASSIKRPGRPNEWSLSAALIFASILHLHGTMNKSEGRQDPNSPDAIYAKATKAELARQFNQAFQQYVKAAELYLHLCRPEGTSEKDKARWKSQAQKALDRAEKLKAYAGKTTKPTLGTPTERMPSEGDVPSEVRLAPVAIDQFSLHELYRVLKKGGHVNGLYFPLWDESEPKNAPRLGGELFHDPDGQPPLSSEQKAVSAVWKRPNYPRDDTISEVRILAQDILQHVVTDCSVCASVSVCLEHSRRFGSHIAEAGLHHYFHESVYRETWEITGRMDFKFLFNGAWRRVVIDDQLPYDPQKGTLMCMSTLADKPSRATLWLSLLEKAYMKLMGGYEFPGSNSCIDLHAIAGWIPEHIEIRRSDFERERTWERVSTGFASGRCMITLGTGPNLASTDGSLKLLPSHSYAVTDVFDGDEGRMVTILDSWVCPNSAPEQGERSRMPTISWEDALNMFEGVYLSWDPSIWKNTVNFHGMWKRGDPDDVSKQLYLTFTNGGAEMEEVWVLLTRHTPDTRKTDDFIALKVQVDDDFHSTTAPPARQPLVAKETYTNSTHVFVRTRLCSSERAGILSILASYDGSSSDVGFTITTYSSSHVDIKWNEAVLSPPYNSAVHGTFTLKNAGGNCTHRTWMINPQYHLRIIPPAKGQAGRGIAKAKTTFSLTAGKDVPVNVTVVWSGGKRVTELSEQDMIASSGAYTYGSARVSKDMMPGDATIVVSAFETRYLGPFTLKVECALPFDLVPIPHEGAGMYCIPIQGSWNRANAGGSPGHSTYGKNPKYELDVPAISKSIIRLQLVQPSTSATRLNVTVYPASPPSPPSSPSTSTSSQPQHVATSGAYDDALAGVAIPQTTLRPGKYVVVPSTYKPGVEAEFKLICYFSSSGVKVTAL